MKNAFLTLTRIYLVSGDLCTALVSFLKNTYFSKMANHPTKPPFLNWCIFQIKYHGNIIKNHGNIETEQRKKDAKIV